MEPNEVLGRFDDEELVRAMARGSGRAFGELRRRHHSRIWQELNRAAVGVANRAALADDALREAFARAVEHRGDVPVAMWLRSICAELVRRELVERELAAAERIGGR
ncbi:MAG: hypothetical protein R2749_03495 [Acidimicrobiales bacterium]